MNFSDRLKSEYQKSGPNQTPNIREIAQEIADEGKQKMLSGVKRSDRQYIKRDVFGKEKLVVPVTIIYIGEYSQEKTARGHVSRHGYDGEIYAYQTFDKNDCQRLVESISEICQADGIKVSLQNKKEIGSTLFERNSYYLIFEIKL